MTRATERVAVAVGRADLGQPPAGRVGRGRVGHRAGRDLDQHAVRVEAGQVERERRWRDDLGAPAPVGLPRTDTEVRVKRTGDLLVDEPGEALAVDPADDLAEQMAERERVIAGGGARRPPRRLGGQRRRRALQVVQVGDGERRIPAGHAGGVAHQVPDEDALLALSGELRPVARDRSVQVHQAPVGEHEHGQARHRLGRRPDVHDRVALPGPAPRLVGETAPDVGHGLPVDVHGQRQAALGA